MIVATSTDVHDAGPSQTVNGWDDPVDGWELQPSYSTFGNNNDFINNGKAPWDTISNGSGSFTKVKSRKGSGGSIASAPSFRGGSNRQGSSRNYSGANSDRTSPRQQQQGSRGTPPGRGGGRGKNFNGGRGAKAAAANSWGQNQNARQYEDYGAPRGWETTTGNGAPTLNLENGWQQVGGSNNKSRNNGSECSSRSAPSGSNNSVPKAWHQGARASTQLVSAGSSGTGIL